MSPVIEDRPPHRYSLVELVERARTEFQSRDITFALAGGIVADIYRSDPRTTDDVDFVVALSEKDVARAIEVIEVIGLTPAVATEAILQGQTRFKGAARRSPAQMVVGRDPQQPFGLDLLLLSLPWATAALTRAQHNLLPFGASGTVPCLTVEDIIISKLHAIKNNSLRRIMRNDIPDVANILVTASTMDIAYIGDTMVTMGLVLPKGVEEIAPTTLARISRKNRRLHKHLDF